MPEDGYGWEKLFSERMCRHFLEDFGLQTRVARYHNVYGPHGTWDGGREKAPAAICRKVATAEITGEHDDRDLGRRRADPQLHVHRRLRARHPDDHWPATVPSRSTSAATSWSRSTSWSTSSRTSPASSSSAATTSTRRRACAAATATTPMIHRIYGWEPSIVARRRPGEDLRLGLRPGRSARSAERCGSWFTTTVDIRSRRNSAESWLAAATR